MVRSITLTVALLAIPALAGAEKMYRWRDASGGLHYGNVARLAPPDAQEVTTTISHLTLPPAGEAPPIVAGPESLAPPRERGIDGARAGGCCPFGGFYAVVLNNPHELADQVKQASLLDALGVSWRRRGCR